LPSDYAVYKRDQTGEVDRIIVPHHDQLGGYIMDKI